MQLSVIHPIQHPRAIRFLNDPPTHQPHPSHRSSSPLRYATLQNQISPSQAGLKHTHTSLCSETRRSFSFFLLFKPALHQPAPPSPTHPSLYSPPHITYPYPLSRFNPPDHNTQQHKIIQAREPPPNLLNATVPTHPHTCQSVSKISKVNQPYLYQRRHFSS